MKKLVSFILVCGVLLLPSTVLARLGAIPIVQIVPTDLGDTAVSRLSSGEVRVKTVGLSVNGMLECASNQDCLDTGLDDTSVNILLNNLQIQIETESAEVTGRARGDIALLEANMPLPDTARFRGKIKGQVTCVGAPPSPCQISEVEIVLRVFLVDPEQKSPVGIMELMLVGILTAGDGGAQPSWTSFYGDGALALFFAND